MPRGGVGGELVVLRPFGPFGPGDRPERLIPHVVGGLVSRRRVAVTRGEFAATTRTWTITSPH